MLRPISQLRPRPSRTDAQPTPMMMLRVRVCEACSVVVAAASRFAADAMILSAIGDRSCVLSEISFMYRTTFCDSLIQVWKASA